MRAFTRQAEWSYDGTNRLRPVRLKLWHIAILCFGTCIASGWTTQASAQQFSVQNVKTELVDDVYRLDAKLQYHFTKEALEALENGVSLTLVLDIEVIKPRRYMWDENIATLEQRYEIQFHALTDQYLLNNKNSGSRSVYSTLDEALSSLGQINNLPIIDAHLLNKEDHYMVQVRSRLDLDSLPVPLRLKGYFSSDWWLTSGWYSWDL